MTRTTQLRIPLTCAIAGTVVVLVAGCGGGGKPTPKAGAGSGTPPKSIVSDAYKFSSCMRAHGVSGFPDPVVNSSPGHQSIGIRVDPAETGSPDFKSAQKACAGIMPGAGNGNGNGPSPAQEAAHVKGIIGFADCMRTHHVPTFPDPTSQGQLTPQMLSAAGIDLHAPAVIAAAKGCVPASDGQITAVQVAQALNGGG